MGLCAWRSRPRTRPALSSGAQEVAVGDAAGHQHAVVVVGADLVERLVDRQLVGVVEVVEALDLARPRG
jgi:hypothetical protein